MPSTVRQWSKVDPNVRKLFAAMWRGEARWPLYLWSKNPGTGKTCAAFAFADMILLSRSVSFVRFAGALADAKCGREGWASQEHFWSHWGRQRLVVIDDIGVRGRPTETEYDALKGILDARGSTPLILTGNFGVEALATIYDHRIMDRIANGGTVVEMLGESRRGT